VDSSCPKRQNVGRAGPWLSCVGALFAASALLACDDLSRFDNADGSAYCGNIVAAEFVREGFDHRPRLQLRLNMDSLDEVPGRLRTDDAEDGPCAPLATFEDAKLRISRKLQADSLSQLQFGEQREINLLTWVDSSCDGTYLAVVSLLKDDSVEVRMMRSEADAKGRETGPFGLFRLTRHAAECGF
jgi:hypothetical protein